MNWDSNWNGSDYNKLWLLQVFDKYEHLKEIDKIFKKTWFLKIDIVNCMSTWSWGSGSVGWKGTREDGTGRACGDLGAHAQVTE